MRPPGIASQKSTSRWVWLTRSGPEDDLTQVTWTDDELQNWICLRAKLGANRRGLAGMAVDAGGIETGQERPAWTLVYGRGHGLAIYGSGGWVFESLRAC